MKVYQKEIGVVTNQWQTFGSMTGTGPITHGQVANAQRFTYSMFVELFKS